MKLGIIGYASPTGLGIQTQDYYRFLKPHKTLLIDLSPLNHLPVDYSKFTDNQIGEVQVCMGIPQFTDVTNFCKDLDVLLIAETPLNYFIINKCREMGIKTVLHYNYEFLDYLNQPHLPKPDLLLAPTLWHWADMVHNAADWHTPLKFLPVPVNREVLPYHPRTSIKRFLHIAGHATAEDRNGTEIVHQAIKLVKNPNVEFIIRAQRSVTTLPSDKRVMTIVEDVPNYYDLYLGADALLMPRRYGGLCLPLNEAMSTGMVPLMTNVSPQNLFLPSKCLIPGRLGKILQTRAPIGVYDASPMELAARIEELAALPEEDVMLLSEEMNLNADAVSWQRLLPEYRKTFRDVLANRIAVPSRYVVGA